MADNSLAEISSPSFSLTEILEQQPHPTFVLDLDPDEAHVGAIQGLQAVFCNKALLDFESLHEAILSATAKGLPSSEGTYEDFKTWASGITPHDDTRDVFPSSYRYGGYLFVGSTIRRRWRLISATLLSTTTNEVPFTASDAPPRVLPSGEPRRASVGGERKQRETQHSQPSQFEPSKHDVQPKQNVPTRPQAPPKRNSGNPQLTAAESLKAWRAAFAGVHRDKDSSSGSTWVSSMSSTLDLASASPDRPSPDWTLARPHGVLSDHVKLVRSVDWASTPLGSMDSWTPEFRQLANVVMGNPHPAALFWGSDLTLLYNEAYADEVAGSKHPELLGTGFAGPFSELWDGVAAIFQDCAATGVSIRRDHDYLPMERGGFLEETFFTWSFTPVYGGTNRILGFYNAPFDMSQEERFRRAMDTVNHLGHLVSQANKVKEFWGLVIQGLERNPFDVPFALLYSVGEADDYDHSSVSSGSNISHKSCRLEGSIGVPAGHPSVPERLDLRRGEGLVPAFRDAMRAREATLLLRTRDNTLPMLEGIEWKGFGDPSKEAVIIVCRPTEENVLAFLLIGLNPRRPYDAGYQSFISMLSRQVSSSLASVILFEEEVRQSRDAADVAVLAQEKLSLQLAMESDRLKRMTQLSPLGMVLISPDGELLEANECFFDMTGLTPRDSLGESNWRDCVVESSRGEMKKGWQHLTIEHSPWSGELQFSKETGHSIDANGERMEYWVLFTAQPEFSDGGVLRSIMGSITDISQLKWAQGIQDKRFEESEERRRQQNEFIDITSHEMRNPLSAILQSSDDITRQLSTKAQLSDEVIESCLDSASTITLCAQHQKEIFNDILTISKLAANLLVVTPVPTQPVSVVERCLRMLQPEVSAKDIDLSLRKDITLDRLEVDWMLIDSSRVLQMLINLMTNAIKFTASANQREIVVKVAASAYPPTFVNSPNFEYIPAKARSSSPSAGTSGLSEEHSIFLQFTVSDTGCGLTEEEKQVLFKRFSQASPRTHAQYGGSGLGLYISRQLAELHGGQIGVASESGVGSTFAFYIAAQRASRQQMERAEDLRELVSNSGSETGSMKEGIALSEVAAPALAIELDDSLAVKKAPTTAPKDLHILVVEDNQINQKVLVKQLKHAGSKVSTSNDGIEALSFLDDIGYRRLGAQKLDIVLMDLEMPNMDGLTCVREIRRLEADSKLDVHLPVIAVTANVRDEQLAEAMAAGMDAVCPKPFRVPDLYKTIESVLQKQARQQ